MNKALGAKLVWRMVSRTRDWWKEVIRKIYLRKPCSTILSHPWDGQDTSIWQLCKSSLKIIKNDYYWIPGNGKKIKVWGDRVLGNPPLSSLLHMEDLSKWANDNGLVTLYDLSTWDRKRKLDWMEIVASS